MSIEQNAARRKLSLAMIVRDEAAVLAETIESVKDIVDDIFILDTGSADDTVRIAREAGARVATLPWTDDFSVARNCAMDQIESDWVLWLDAGETLSAESKASVREFVDTQADPGRVYMLMVVVPPADPSSSAEQTARMRLLPNHPDLRFHGRVREDLEKSVKQLGLSVDMAPGRIHRHRRENLAERKAGSANRCRRMPADRNASCPSLPNCRRGIQRSSGIGEGAAGLSAGDPAGGAWLDRNARRILRPADHV
jgi:hypothetical protein